MSLHYVIDGYNLIRHRSYKPSNRSFDEKNTLLHTIRHLKLCKSPKNRVTVVFDGFPGGFEPVYKDIEVIFSGDSTADDKIKKIMSQKDDPKNLIVVSDDRHIRDSAKIHSIRSLSVEDFLCIKKTAGSGPVGLKPDISYSEMYKINKELRDIWLKDD